MKTVVAEVGTIFLAAVIILMILGTSTSSFFTDVNAKTKEKNSKSGSTSSTSTSTASDKTSSHKVKNGKTKRTKTPKTNAGGGTAGGAGGGPVNVPPINQPPVNQPPPNHNILSTTCDPPKQMIDGKCYVPEPKGHVPGPNPTTYCFPPKIIYNGQCMIHLGPPINIPIPPKPICLPPRIMINGKCVFFHRIPPGPPPGCSQHPSMCPPSPPPLRHPCPPNTHRVGMACVPEPIVVVHPVIKVIHQDVTHRTVTIERIINNQPVQQTVHNIIIHETDDSTGPVHVTLPTVNFIDENNIGHIVGVIKNDGNTDVKIVDILATLKDKDGKTLDIPHGTPVATKLRPGESTTFEIELLQTVFRVADIESIVFHVDATG